MAVSADAVRRAAAEAYAAAITQMRGILATIEHCLAVEDEVEALSAQLDELESAGALLIRDTDEESGEQETQRVQAMAREMVSGMPLSDLCRDRELIGVFTAELVQEILRTANQRQTADRRKRQADGIAVAKAKGVQFGRRRAPLPSNFEEARLAWRSGDCSLREASKLCGMSRTSFYRAVLQSEEAAVPTAWHASRTDVRPGGTV